jgi:cysteine synthase A
MIYDRLTDLIGHTPCLFFDTVNGNRIYLKLEMFNPAGSVKDRIALSMVEALEREGKLSADKGVIEATSGNTGIGLAYVLAAKGIPLTLTMPASASKERVDLMKAYGAKVVLTPAELSMHGAKARAEQLANELGYVYLEQFSNPNNPAAHMKTTANEIRQDFPKLDYIVCGVGTGGTITGLGQILRPKYPGIRFIAVEPFESAVLSGEAPGAHQIAGIGAGFIPPILDRSQIDDIVKVKTSAAQALAKKLATRGHFYGVSGAAAIIGALEVAQTVTGKTMLVIIPDGGIKYMSTGVFNHE